MSPADTPELDAFVPALSQTVAHRSAHSPSGHPVQAESILQGAHS